jgi:hypothetical protein
MEEARRLAQSEAGQQLLTLFRNQSPSQLHRAMQQASSGDYEQLKQTLQTLMASPEANTLLNQLEKKPHE